MKDSQKYLQNLTYKIAMEDDHQSFRQLFNYYYEKLFRVAFHFVKSDFIADEVISELFINLWKKRNNLTNIRNIESFLYYSAKNKSIDYLRKIEKTKVVPIELATEEAAVSRLYGGIHYRDANENGTLQGLRIGKHVVERIVNSTDD